MGVYFSKLALDGMKKNRKLYMPYILTCILMVAVFYILRFLSVSKVYKEMPGGGNAVLMMALGSVIICVFSVIFLFYTNVFLMRRRRKEFGLYNILGMSKKNLAVILVWETLISYVISAAGGLFAGIALSKFSELILLNLIEVDVNYNFNIYPEAVVSTLCIFGLIFALILLNNIRKISFSEPVELMKSESVGEKPPKANYVLGIAGIVLLAIAYYLAVTIEQPLAALVWFMIAVIMVIIASYLIFIAGSVTLCRVLQKKKGYYYQKKHFISVSSMSYRMKRNGAGLASICILLTMVLVMLSSTSSLYFGAEDCMRSHYPKDICGFMTYYGYQEDSKGISEKMEKAAAEVAEREGIDVNDLVTYGEYTITGLLEDSNVKLNLNSESKMAFVDYEKITEVHFIDVDVYNRIYGLDKKLSGNEALVCAVKTRDVSDVLKVGEEEFVVKERIDRKALDFDGSSESSVTANIFVIVDDASEAGKKYSEYKDFNGSDMLLNRWFYQFNTTADIEKQEKASVEMAEALKASIAEEGLDTVNAYVNVKQAERSDYYGTFGGLLFLGLLLSLVFLVAAVLIIYYKQVSEGFEDQSRFEIMQKVGMTKEDIRSTINSQMLTVFLLPIAFAALHMAFAFPFVNKLLMLFGLFNVKLLVTTTLICILVCAVFYLVIYRLTSNVYYSIVAKGEK